MSFIEQTKPQEDINVYLNVQNKLIKAAWHKTVGTGYCAELLGKVLCI